MIDYGEITAPLAQNQDACHSVGVFLAVMMAIVLWKIRKYL